ncbi:MULTISPECIES: ATP-dependent DNA helicase RecG [unclassified Sphingopyxis]|uniref:ATP-dependent DNA helicase RecG n=1 Tax=unclassified Sphingopyxis TaxID=2614943 RepID=UPI0028583D94|nr:MULTISPECIES: ATP-dependent DNA helicase RecG [unclassified Sphingopyxis]MDR6832528.1 ATP-dependent DNA helicase RecG [Sphingopyxis sp. BE122]MDR7228271.1 ATP-dependent DNA helicase RecG [Sphingopyxis sp. BE259]
MRPEILNPLFAALTDLKGVGPQLAKPLARLGLERVVDVLFHLPTGLVQRYPIDRLDQAQVGQQIIVTLTAQEYRSGRSPRAPFGVEAFDTAGDHVRLVYFGRTAGLAKKLFPLGEARQVSGRLDAYGEMRQIVHPDHVAEPDSAEAIATSEAVYPLTEGLTNARLSQLVEIALERRPELAEWIDGSLLTTRSWPAWREALTRAHASPHDAAAHDRLAYDEIFASQVALMLIREGLRKRKGRPVVGDGRLIDALRLPFGLTGAQERVGREIAADMGRETPMLRMLQGDVGSGKTLVALRAMLAAVEAGTQAALLAPTEILARQHFATLQAMLAGLPVNIAILTGRDKGRVRESTLMGLADGSIDILVGTHAIFQDAVAYRDLTLVVVDEQHRFGVAQRLMLTQKAARPPHLLVMTATPIPRTLQLANHGEMDVSRIDEMPPGRTPVDTRVVSVDRLDEVIGGLERHLATGAQAYWVCPLVAESEMSELAAAEDRAALLRERLGADRVGLVHGRMKGPDKDDVMARFQAGQIGVLVATTVIEVGVDVPAASLMIVEHADRFGLAQLHQLRGRVGRGAAKSVCLLLRSQNLSETARERLALMRETNDGFVIAEKDLELRGGGELLGLKQSGDADYGLASPEQLVRLLPVAHDDAQLFVERDGGMDGARGEAVRHCLYLFERDAAVPLLRSG